jgi:hypothetical protein
MQVESVSATRTCSSYFELLRVGVKRNPYRVLVGKSKRKRPLGRSRRMWEDTIKIDEIGCGGMDWIHLAQDRDQWRGLMNTVMNLRVP